MKKILSFFFSGCGGEHEWVFITVMWEEGVYTTVKDFHYKNDQETFYEINSWCKKCHKVRFGLGQKKY